MGAPGFDDCPEVEVQVGVLRRRVTMVYPYYDNPGFLGVQLEGWSMWQDRTRESFQLIVVDDCSPGTPALDVLTRWPNLPFPTRLFRVERDVRWGWPAARNIGMANAMEGWCLLTDMDHVLHEASAITLAIGDFDPEIIYRPHRTERSHLIHPHPNSMFMTREMFWKIGGYDERVLGFYGSDSYWRRRCARYPVRLMSNVGLERREHEGDSSTVRYKRKQPEDAGLRPLMRAAAGRPPLLFSQPYHEEHLS